MSFGELSGVAGGRDGAEVPGSTLGERAVKTPGSGLTVTAVG